MEHTDTIKLLQECDAGAKMATASINEVLDNVADSKMKELLAKSEKEHADIDDEIHSLLKKYNSEQKEPSPIAKGMSWMKTNFKIGMDNRDATIADLVTDGCNMGIKSLYRYLNQYKAADTSSVEICKRLASIEEGLCKELRVYL